MKVLFVYKYLTLGGVETVVRARLGGLDRWGIEAHAWFFHDLGGRPVFAGVEDRVHLGEPASCVDHAVRNEFDLLCSIDTEEVFPWFGDSSRVGSRDGSRKPRLVVECHSPYLENIEYLRGLTKRRPAAVFVPSEHQRRIVRERVGEGRVGEEVAVRVVPNPLRRAFVREPEPFPAPPKPVVAWIGRLDDLKNWKGFVELAGALTRRGAGAEYWIAGKPVETSGAGELLEQARAAGVLGHLRWFRGLPHDRVPALIDAVRDSGGAVVSTSRGESFGMTVAEAMARGCAVAVPGVPPFTEFVEDGATGVLFEPGSAVSAADAVQGLLTDAARRAALGGRAREAILARFAPDTALAALAGELERLR